MAVTFTEANRASLGNRMLVMGAFAFDSAYPSGGEAAGPGLFGLTVLDFVLAETSGTEHVTYDRATGKMKIYTADGTEATGDQSAIQPRVIVVGI